VKKERVRNRGCETAAWVKNQKRKRKSIRPKTGKGECLGGGTWGSHGRGAVYLRTAEEESMREGKRKSKGRERVEGGGQDTRGKIA